MKISACLFDLDGVIVDTAKYHYLAWKRLAREVFNKNLTTEHNERLKGIGRLESLDILLRLFGIIIPEEEKTVLAEKKNNWYVGYIRLISKDEILPGFMDFLTGVKNLGLKTAVGSASKNTGMIMEKLELTEMFDSIVDGTNITRGKPDPEIFLKCAEELHIDPQYCLVFEDAAAGIDAALSAGMHAIGVGDQKLLRKAYRVIPSFINYSADDLLKTVELKSV